MARHLDETLVQAQVVSDGVLPALLVVPIVGVVLHDVLVDAVEGEPLVGRRLDGHHDERVVAVGGLLVLDALPFGRAAGLAGGGRVGVGGVGGGPGGLGLVRGHGGETGGVGGGASWSRRELQVAPVACGRARARREIKRTRALARARARLISHCAGPALVLRTLATKYTDRGGKCFENILFSLQNIKLQANLLQL